MASPADLDINLSDPRVRALVTGDESRIHQPGKREMVQLAGDPMHGHGAVRDPSGKTNNMGIMSTHHLDHDKIEVLVSYRGRAGDFDMTVDVYRVGNELEVHFICPKCKKAGRVTAARKKMEFEQGDTRPYTFVDGSVYPTNGGRLFVQPFECGHEMPDAGAHVAGIKSGGITLCRQRLAIENSIAKDA